jgi:predicted dehydrogenase
MHFLNNNPKGTLRRRDFLKSAGVLAVGASFGVPQFLATRVLGDGETPAANDRLQIGVIGVGARGLELLRQLSLRSALGEIDVAAIADPDEKRLEKALEAAGPQAKAYRDYRSILTSKEIQAVVIATPTHWHGVQAAQAAECGKHLYLETPACSTVAEGAAMLAAMKKSKIVVQVGSQSASMPEAAMMHRYLANGAIGRVTQVDCWSAPSPVDERSVSDGDSPTELDYDLWLGPLRWRPFNPRFSHGNFRWTLESGGGRLCDVGAHLVALALRWLDAESSAPATIEAQGVAPSRGLWDAPVELKATFTFKNPDWTLTWNQPGEPIPAEERAADEAKIAQADCGMVFRGESGEAHVWGGVEGIWAERKVRQWNPAPAASEMLVYRSPGHFEEWFRCIKTGEKTIGNLEAGVAAANVCNLGNLAYLLDRKLQWDQAKTEIAGDPAASRLLSRPQRFPYSI